jgi:hypothetical protein
MSEKPPQVHLTLKMGNTIIHPQPALKDGQRVCPKCGVPLVPTPGTMYYRGRWFAGLVCTTCNALWDNPDDSMLEYAREIAAG